MLVCYVMQVFSSRFPFVVCICNYLPVIPFTANFDDDFYDV